MHHKNFKDNILNYLENSDLNDHLSLVDDGLLSFHWADCKHTGHIVNSMVNNDRLHHKRLKDLELELELLKSIPVWLKNRKQEMKGNLYELYESFTRPLFREYWKSLNDEVLISVQNEAGPFQPLCQLKWYESKIYANFIYLKLLKENKFRREFRFGSNVNLKIFPNEEVLSSITGKIHQVSISGLVIKFKQRGFFNYWSKEGYINFRQDINLENKVNHLGEEFRWLRNIGNFQISSSVVMRNYEKYFDKNHSKGIYLFFLYDDIYFNYDENGKYKSELISFLKETNEFITKNIKIAA